jgi:indolepyruvate ferredoxin oxidoreductase
MTCNLYIMGIGGTGVVSVNQILGTAAFLEGRTIQGLDQTGLSQKGGPVVSNLKIMERPAEVSNKVAAGAADLYLVLDILSGAAVTNLSHALPDRTYAVVSTSVVATGAMIRSSANFPDLERLQATIAARTRAGETVYLDAVRLAETFFGSHMPANLIAVGAAYQAGLIPISAGSIERAIALNDVAVESNVHAFRIGRKIVADPSWMSSLDLRRPSALDIEPVLTPAARALIEQCLSDKVGVDGELRRLLERRVPELIAYQDEAYARQYTDFVRRVLAAEQTAMPGETRLSEAVARNLFKLMAYKDEYEVARLHLLPQLSQAIAGQFGEDATIRYQLHPPLLRALGLRKKIGLGRWFDPLFRLLVWMRRLRGTALDPFGHTQVRRVERALVDEYRTLIEESLVDLRAANYALVVQLAELPDLIRGYEEIKLRNVERFRAEVDRVQQEIRRAGQQRLLVITQNGNGTNGARHAVREGRKR